MIGQLVTSKAGHDKEVLYMVYGESGEFVYLCDGRYKTPDKLKKKSRKHIQPIKAWVPDDMIEKIKAQKKVYPEEIRFALKQYLKTRGLQQ